MSSDRSLRLQVILEAADRATAPMQRMLASTGGLSKAVKEAREHLKQLDASRKTLDSFRDTAAKISTTNAALEAARNRVRELRDQIVQAEKPHKNLTDEYQRMRSEARKLERQSESLAKAQAVLSGNLKTLGVPISEVAAKHAELVSVMDKLNARMRVNADRLGRLKALQRQYNDTINLRDKLLGAGASGMAAGAAMGLPILNMVKAYASFEDAMLGVARQVEGARDANGRYTQTYHDMANAIVDLSRRVPMATTEIAALVEAGARMGIQGKQDLLTYAETAATAATAFDAAAGEIGENIARIANLYKIPIANISELGDTINWLDDNAQSKGADIIEVMQRIAGISQTVGMSFKDAAALGSTFLSLGASAEVAATASNAVIRELAIAANQPKRFQQALASIGLAPDAVQNGMIKDSTGTILRVLEAIKALPREQQISAAVGLFGKEYGDDVAKLAENMEEYRLQLAEANSEQARGSMAREADAKNMTLSARWQMTLNRLFADSAQGGSALKGVIFSLLDTVDNMLDGINRFMQAHPGFTQAFIVIGAAVATLVTGVSGLMVGVVALLGPLALVKLAIGILAPTIGAALLAASPFLLWIGAVAVAAVQIYRNWDSIKDAFVGVFRFIGEGIERYFTSRIRWVLEKVRAAQEMAAKFGIGDGPSSPAAAPLLAAAGGSSFTTNTGPIYITQQPGQSGHDLAAEVQRQLDARDRAIAARGRSRLSDME